jgi:hypothetical protein
MEQVRKREREGGDVNLRAGAREFFEKKIFFEQVVSLLYLFREATKDFAVRLGLV